MPLEPKNLAAGTEVWIGTPAQPLPESTVARLRAALDQIAGVIEGHLPLVYAAGLFEPPAQVLVLVLGQGVEPESIWPHVEAGLKSALPANQHLDVWPMRSDDASLGAVRQTGCTLKSALGVREKRPWWKLWNAR